MCKDLRAPVEGGRGTGAPHSGRSDLASFSGRRLHACYARRINWLQMNWIANRKGLAAAVRPAAVLAAVLAVFAAAALVCTTTASAAGLRVTAGASPPIGARDSANLHGQLTDNAVVIKKVANATVTVGGMTVKADGKGRFELLGVTAGQEQIVVKAPGHADYQSTMVVQPGDNQVTVALDLTVFETYKRNFKAYSQKRYSVSYQILHPDVRAHYTYARYVAYMKTVPDIVSYKITRSRKLASWHAPYLGKTYRNVWAITRVLRYHDSSGYFTDDPLTMHWGQVEGRWYAIFNWQLTQSRAGQASSAP